MLHRINEAFENMYRETKLQENTKHCDLLMALKRARESLQRNGNNNLKAYEIAYQDVIENYFPDKAWWETVDLNIFEDLFNNRDPQHTELEIVKHVKEDVDEDLLSTISPVTSKIVDTQNNLIKSVIGESEEDDCKNEGCVVKRKRKVDEILDPNLQNVNVTLSPSISTGHIGTGDVKAEVGDIDAKTGDIASAAAGLGAGKAEVDDDLTEGFEKGFEFENSGMECEVLDTNGEYTLVHAKNKKFQPYIVAYLLRKNRDDDEYSWGQGHYFSNEEDAREYLSNATKEESLKESKNTLRHIRRIKTRK